MHPTEKLVVPEGPIARHVGVCALRKEHYLVRGNK